MAVALKQPAFEPSLTVRNALAGAARNFHKSAGTLTDAVSTALAELVAGAPIVNVSHEPNTFVSHSINIQPHALRDLAGGRPGAPPGPRPTVIFMCIDYDEAGDRRFRTGTLPGPLDQASIRLVGAVPQRHHRTMSYVVPQPPADVVARWRATIDMAMRACRRSWPSELRRPLNGQPEAIGRVIELLEQSYTTGTRLVFGNMSMMSHLRNAIAGDGTLFVSATELVKELGSTLNDSRDALAVAVGETIESGLAEHVWRVCSICAARAACVQAHLPRLVEWHCRRCGATGLEPLDFTQRTVVANLDLPVFVPRVSLCNALDLEIYRFSGTCVYAGGIDHILGSRRAYLSAGHDRLPPLLAWDPCELLCTPGGVAHSRLLSSIGPERLDLFQRGRFAQFLHFGVIERADTDTTASSYSAYREGE